MTASTTDQAPDVYAVCQCGYYDFPAMRDQLVANYKATAYRNALHLTWRAGEIFIFDYGVIVFWNVSASDREPLFGIIRDYINEPLTDVLQDEFTYDFSNQSLTLKNDHISLPDQDILTRLAVSHGIAQSTKLEQYEARVLKTIASTEHIPENIAKTGRSGLRRKDLSKLPGFLYLTKSDVMLHYDLLDVPEFFWEYPELQSYYSAVADYLEIRPRIEVLNKKLETIQDLLSMIADEQKHQHSSLLEWIIIWLIAIDIVIILIQELIKHYTS